MTLEEKNKTLRDLGDCIQEAKRYFDNGNDCFSVALGCWKIEFDRQNKRRNQMNTPANEDAMSEELRTHLAYAEHAPRIERHYKHAREKHPYFCDRALPPLGGKSKEIIENILSGLRKDIVVDAQHDSLHWKKLLDCKVWEALEAIATGDYAHAVEKCYDAIAIILRIIDVMERREKFGRYRVINFIERPCPLCGKQWLFVDAQYPNEVFCYKCEYKEHTQAKTNE